MKKILRFEVFKRDSFTCQYCGREAPSVVLEVDHIIPKSKGGIEEIENLITSCFECNRGKGAKDLNSIPTSASKNTEFIKEKSLQLEEFYKYQRKLIKIQEKIINDLADYWESLQNYNSSLSEIGKASIGRFLKMDYPTPTVEDIKNAMSISAGKIKNPSEAFRYMCGILHNQRKQKQINALNIFN